MIQDNFPQIRNIRIIDYLKEIDSSIENKNYLSALSLALMIPDICIKSEGKSGRTAYANWFNKYVYRKYLSFPTKKELKKKNIKNKKIYQIKFNGYCCYALRCAMLHSGTNYIEYENEEKDKKKARIDNIELCVNSEHDKDSQFGGGVSIFHNGNYERVTIRVNIVNLVSLIQKGCYDYLSETKKANEILFLMTDFDKIGGNIIFTPNDSD